MKLDRFFVKAFCLKLIKLIGVALLVAIFVYLIYLFYSGIYHLTSWLLLDDNLALATSYLFKYTFLFACVFIATVLSVAFLVCVSSSAERERKLKRHRNGTKAE